MYLLFVPATIAIIVIGFITLRDQFAATDKSNGYVFDPRVPEPLVYGETDYAAAPMVGRMFPSI